MKMTLKKILMTILSVTILCSSMVVFASAAYTVHQQDLDKPYYFSEKKDYRTYTMGYELNTVKAHTRVQLGGGSGEAAKAYAALMERTYLFGADGEFKQASNTTVSTDGYVWATAKGSTNKANYTLHSGTSNVTYGWRFDHQYTR